MSYYQNHTAREQTVTLLQKLLLTLYDENCFEIHEKIVRYHKRLIAQFHDCEDYLLFHVMMGSTPPADCTKWDFEGEFCIKDFILKEYRQLLPDLADGNNLIIPQEPKPFEYVSTREETIA